MDFGTSVIGMIFLLFCVIIFVILSRSNRKREKEVLQTLKRLAADNKCTITQYDTWNNSGIGIDKKTNIIFSTRNINNHSNSLQVMLPEMKKCKVVRSNTRGRHEGGNFNAIEKIELVFTSLDSSKPETIVVFYSADIDGPSLNGEIQVIEKWRKIANDQLSALSLKK